MLYTSRAYVEMHIGDPKVLEGLSRGSQEEPQASRIIAEKIRAASATVSAALCKSGRYAAFERGRKLTGEVQATLAINTLAGIGTTFEDDLDPSSALRLGSVIVFDGMSYLVAGSVSQVQILLDVAADRSYAGEAFTVEGDAATASAIIRNASILAASYMAEGTAGMSEGVKASLPAVEEWLDAIRSGDVCLTPFDGSAAEPRPASFAWDAERGQEPFLNPSHLCASSRILGKSGAA